MKSSVIKEMTTEEGQQPAGDASMASDDISWKQLKQVHSIDDAAIQEHLGLKKKAEASKAAQDVARNRLI